MSAGHVVGNKGATLTLSKICKISSPNPGLEDVNEDIDALDDDVALVPLPSDFRVDSIMIPQFPPALPKEATPNIYNCVVIGHVPHSVNMTGPTRVTYLDLL